MMVETQQQAPLTLRDWLAALLSARPEDQRAVALEGVAAGIAMAPVVCVLHGGTYRWVSAYRHVAHTERQWREAHPEDGENAALHRLGSLRPAEASDAPPPFPWETARCRSCGREIVWALTERGKRNPIDVAPNPNGNIVLVAPNSDYYEPPHALVLHTEADRAGVQDDQIHTSHFATCPNAADWRRSP